MLCFLLDTMQSVSLFTAQSFGQKDYSGGLSFQVDDVQLTLLKACPPALPARPQWLLGCHSLARPVLSGIYYVDQDV